MAYTYKNYKTKKSLKMDVADGVAVRCYQPNGDITGAELPKNGTIFLEGPHFPEPHKWYAEATVKDGIVVKVK
jgi:hypothetical protein